MCVCVCVCAENKLNLCKSGPLHVCEVKSESSRNFHLRHCELSGNTFRMHKELQVCASVNVHTVRLHTSCIKHKKFINKSEAINTLRDCMSEKLKRMNRSLIFEGFCSFRVLSARGSILPKSSSSIMVAGANCIHPPRNEPRALKHNIYSRAYLTYLMSINSCTEMQFVLCSNFFYFLYRWGLMLIHDKQQW